MAESREPNSSHRGWVVPYLVITLLAAYPVAIVFGASAIIEPLDLLAVVRSLAASVAVAFLLYWCLRLVTTDRDARVQWLGVGLALCGTYEIAVNTAAHLGLNAAPTDPRVAVGYVVAVVALATVTVRPWRRSRRDLLPITILAAFLVCVNSYRALERWWNDPPPNWLSAADALSYAPSKGQNTSTSPARDIYYIVLDGLGRADTLKEMYGLDAGPFVANLRASGFYVADGARSNYSQTLLSFSSFLNLDYLDSVASAVGRTSGSREALDFLIQHAGLMRLAKQAGYEVVAVGTDYPPTKRFNEADVCLCQQYGLSMFEQAVLGATPFAAAPVDRWTYGAHREKILASLGALETGMVAPRRQFVFAHILAPHPPFTFAPDGAFRRPNGPFTIIDGSGFEGTRDEYVQGYHDQAAFLLQRIAKIVHAILSRPGPQPVIVIHGDHGPGSRLELNDAAHTDLNERMNIFEAYFFPGGHDDSYESMTPVNLTRALSNQYLGTNLPRLPDISLFSTALQPYEFINVPPETTSGSWPRW